MREKLINLLKTSPTHKTGYCNIEDVADHLILNRVVLLPHNVSSTIYRINPLTREIMKWKIVCVEMYENGFVFVDDSGNRFDEHGVDENSIFTTVFFTRKEAENALMQMGCNNA